MDATADIYSDFSAIVNQDAWSVSRIHGSMFFLEIGEKKSSTYRMHGETREYTHGKWHFMFSMVQWRFEKDGKVVVACEDEQSYIDKVFAALSLGSIRNLSLCGSGQDLLIEFSSGASFKTFSNASAQDDWDQWTLYFPDGKYWRANGRNQLVSGLSSEPRPESIA